MFYSEIPSFRKKPGRCTKDILLYPLMSFFSFLQSADVLPVFCLFFFKNQTVLVLLTVLRLLEEISCLDNVWGLAVYCTTTVNK